MSTERNRSDLGGVGSFTHYYHVAVTNTISKFHSQYRLSVTPQVRRNMKHETVNKYMYWSFFRRVQFGGKITLNANFFDKWKQYFYFETVKTVFLYAPMIVVLCFKLRLGLVKFSICKAGRAWWKMLLCCIMGVVGSTPILGNLPNTRDYKSDASLFICSLWVPQLYESTIYELF